MNKRPAINFFALKWFADCPAYGYGTNLAELFLFSSAFDPASDELETMNSADVMLFFMVDKNEKRCTRRLVFCSKINELDRHGVEFFVLYCFCFDGGCNFLFVKRLWTLSEIPSKWWDNSTVVICTREISPLNLSNPSKKWRMFSSIGKSVVYFMHHLFATVCARAKRHSNNGCK